MNIFKKIILRGLNFIAILLYPLNSIFKKNYFVILEYHSISNFPTNNEVNIDHVPISKFEKQMRFLNKSNYKVINFEQLINLKKPKGKYVLITLDDGYMDNYINAYPIIKKYNIKAMISPAISQIGDKKLFNWLKLNDTKISDYILPIDWTRLRAMSKDSRIEIGSHSLNHKSIGNLDEKEQIREIAEPKKILEKKLKRNINVFVYPFGSPAKNDYNSKTEQLVKKYGYKISLTSKFGSNKFNRNYYGLKRIPIRSFDSMLTFKTKLSGAHDFIYHVIHIFKKFTSILNKNPV